jgi:N-acyl-D-aspartate/D-glutamate deacylase
VDVEADQYAYTAGSSSLSIRFPSWALEGTSAEVAARLNDADTWARIKREMAQLLAERGFTDLSWATGATYRGNEAYNGLTMKAVAQAMFGRDGADDQLEAARVVMLNGGASMVYHFMTEDDVERIMRHPMVGIASDAGVVPFGSGVPHPRGLGNTVRVLGRYVRERKVISLEEAVRKMTSLPARQFRLAGRGEIRVGAAADLVIFDPALVADAATFAAPHAYPVGITHVIVNGVSAVRDGEALGTRSGQVARRSS